MSSLGVGTFDGLFIAANVRARLFASDGSYNAQIVGPAYVSLEKWKDRVCNGYEANTILLPGEDLGQYSIRIGPELKILWTDEYRERNEVRHKTRQYRNRFVLRRGSSFEVSVRLSGGFLPTCHEVYFEMEHTFDGAPTVIEIPQFQGSVPANQWGAELIRVAVGSLVPGDPSRRADLRIHIPANAPVGEYKLRALVRLKGMPEFGPAHQRDFRFPIAVVFNPFAPADDVYLSQGASRHVLAADGMYWDGDPHKINAQRWEFGQFDQTSLNVGFGLLDELTSAERANPILVTRRFSDKTRDNPGDPGILFGKWAIDAVDYSDGVIPTKWHSSTQILKEYERTHGAPVKYAQCWVFAGVLNTLLRTVGIPSRMVTNFNSGEDDDLSGTIDVRLKTNGQIDRAISEKYWNYHVWCEAMMKRPDRPGHDGWQVVDGTYGYGPAPVSAVKATAGGNYHAFNVWTEVDAPYVVHQPPQLGGPPLIDYRLIGWYISTQSLTGTTREDITDTYKTPETPPSPPVSGPGPSGVILEWLVPTTVNLGQEVNWTVRLTNTTALPQAIRIRIYAQSILYAGHPVADYPGVDVTISLVPDQTESVSLVVPAALYTEHAGVSSSLEGTLFAEALDGSEHWLRSSRVSLAEPQLTVGVTPHSVFPVGEQVAVSISYTNPLNQPLTDVRVVFYVQEGLSLEGEHEVTVELGTIGAGAAIEVTRPVLGEEPGEHSVFVKLAANELYRVEGHAPVTVFADCNQNGVDDIVEVQGGQSLDCNGDEIPDACQSDCNNNGVPDDCDLFELNANDCNLNGVPDECDIAWGVSPDANGNGAPDECELDCNVNGIPDFLDLVEGWSFDANQNAIPDECEILVAPLPHNAPKNRYISFSAIFPSDRVALAISRVAPTYSDLGWVGIPDGNGVAQVSALPTFRLWTEALLHVGDCEITPGAVLVIRPTRDGVTYLPAFTIQTIAQPCCGKYWGDTVGVFTEPEWTPPNGIVNANDFLAALQKFQSLPQAPHLTWVDVQSASSIDPCLNQVVNIADVFLLLQAFQGNVYPFTTNPASCPPCGGQSSPPPGGGDGFGEGDGFVAGMDGGGFLGPESSGVALTVEVSPYQIDAEELATVKVFVDSVLDLAAFETALLVTPAEGATGTVSLESVTVNTQDTGFVFYGQSIVSGANDSTGKAGAARMAGTGYNVTGPKYLATYEFRASAGAEGVWEATVDESAYLLDGDALLIESSAGNVGLIRVGLECTAATHCADGNQCTDDVCDSGECSNPNSSSSTPCDDGLFCTATDLCDGNGACAGTGDPCTKNYPQCCESLDMCLDPETGCPQ